MNSRVITITDEDSGSVARVLPGVGFNCFSWQPVLDDGPREMLWHEAGFESGDKRPSGSGIPLLFPFPGRIGGAAFHFHGREYKLEPGDAFGNAIHGFVFNRPWRVVEQTTSRVTGEFQASVDDPSILERWPGDFRVRVWYEVRGRELVSEIDYKNTGDGPLPCGFGTHAYFRLPLSDGLDAEETRVTVPAADVWEADQMLPTGKKLPATGNLNLSDGARLAGRKFDTYFTGLTSGRFGQVRTALADERGRTVAQTFDCAFAQCIVYTPPHREAICLEPYTCLPDPFRMSSAGHETGLQTLQPDESRATTIQLAISG
jgi:aldose 1-epimerase